VCVREIGEPSSKFLQSEVMDDAERWCWWCEWVGVSSSKGMAEVMGLSTIVVVFAVDCLPPACAPTPRRLLSSLVAVVVVAVVVGEERLFLPSL